MKKPKAKLAAGDNTPENHRTLREPWKPGESGNPAGRPKGSRNKLAERFYDDLYKSWEKNGPSAIEALRIESPKDYVRIAAYVLPKEFVVKDASIKDLSEEELVEFLCLLRSQLGEASEEYPEELVKRISELGEEDQLTAKGCAPG